MSRKQKDAAVAQSVVRRIGSAEVTGPIPVSSSSERDGSPYKSRTSIFFVSKNPVDICRQSVCNADAIKL